MLDTADTATEVIETTPAPEQVSLRELNRLKDRCDRCNAEAFMLAAKGESELLFCGHHGAKHLESLRQSGWTIQDDRDKINTQPSPSATTSDDWEGEDD